MLAPVLASGLVEARAEAQRPGRAEIAAEHRARGDALRAAGDRGSAIGWYRDAISADPSDALSYERLGRVYLERGAFDDARAAFEAGVARRPDHAALWLGLAEVLEAMGAPDDAARAMRELTRRAPEDPDAWRARAALAMRRGAWSEALAVYRRIALLPGASEELREEAARSLVALRFLVGTSDPVRRCDEDSEVRRALCR